MKYYKSLTLFLAFITFLLGFVILDGITAQALKVFCFVIILARLIIYIVKDYFPTMQSTTTDKPTQINRMHDTINRV